MNLVRHSHKEKKLTNKLTHKKTVFFHKTMTAQSSITTSSNEDFSSAQIEAGLLNFLESLSNQHCSSATIRNYRSDIRQFYKHEAHDELKEIFTKSALKGFVLAQKQKGLKDSSVTRKIASITQFALWSKQQGLISHDINWLTSVTIESLLKKSVLDVKPISSPEVKDTTIVNEIKKSPSFLKLLGSKKTQTKEEKEPVKEAKEEKKLDKNVSSIFSTPIKHKTKKVSQAASNFILPYLNLGLIVLFFIGLGFLGYNQLVTETPDTLAYPGTPVSASRVLSFQGRLTDTAQNPITTATNMEFKIWDQLSGGTEGTCDGTDDCEYKTSTCSVTPDQDGIFNVGIGDDCGAEITEAVFTENAALWLEVIIAAETLTPRQPIRTVPFAINSETVQGYPISASESATVNTLLVMDAGGYVTLGENNPTLTSTSGTFTISGGTLSLEATSDILFTDARITNLPLSLVDTQIDAALGQGIVDAINDVYALSSSSSFFGQSNNLIYPLEYWSDELAIGGNSTASADIRLGVDGSSVFNEQGNDADFRVEGSTDTDLIFVDASTNNVGIGDESPNSSFKLSVDGKIGGYTYTGSHLEFPKSGDTYAGQTILSSNNGIRFVEGTSLAATISDVNGNFGIGTGTSPASLLEVSGTYAGNALVTLNETGSNDILTASASGVTRFILDNNGYVSAPRFVDLANSAYYLDPAATGYSLLTAGSIGVGDTTPASLFTVGAGDLFQVDTTGSIISIDGVAHSIVDTAGDLELTSNSTNISLNDNVTFAGTTTLNSIAYTWPGADGIADAILSTNGAGTLSWTDSETLSPMSHLDHIVFPDDYWADDFIIGGNSTASADIQLYSDGSAVFNEQGSDVDFRIEGSGASNALFVQGSDGYVGIGTNAPSDNLEISDTKDTNLRLNSTKNGSDWVVGTDTIGGIDFYGNDASGGGANVYGYMDLTTEATAGNLWSLTFGTSSNNNAATEKFRVTSAGDFGIGDTTPDHTLDVAGNIGLDASGYINWGDTDGTTGYGFRDNSGTLQYKNSAGAWTDVGLAVNTYWQKNDGSLSPISISTDINLGAVATASAKISLAGSLDRGKSAIIINQTEAQDIFTASASGTSLFTIQNNGNLSLQNAEYITNSTDDLLVFGGSGGTTDTDLTIDLDGNNPVLYSTSGLGIEINDRLYIGTNNRYFYDEAGQLSFSDDLGIDGSLAIGTVSATGNAGEIITSGNIILANQMDLILREDAGSGTDYTGFQAPTTLATNLLYTLPDSQGSVGEVLTNDGSGVLSWGSNSAGDYWQQNAGMLSPISTTLGINLGATATSSAKISLAGSLDRGMAALIVNQTENQDIFTASSSGTTRFSITNEGNLDVTGNIGLTAGNYVNWGSVLGTSGYGFRDSGGTLQFKHDGGTWADVGTGGGGGGGSLGGYWDLSAGAISPFFPSTDVNIGDSATASAKVSIAGSLDRGMSALIINQSENQDIFTASASGTTRLHLTNTGDLDVYGSGNFGNIASIDDYRTLQARESYTNIDTNDSYSLYLAQTRTESALTGDATAVGSYNQLLYRMNENGNNGVAYGSQDVVYTDGSYTYSNLVADINTIYSTSDAVSGQDNLRGVQTNAFLSSSGTLSNLVGSYNQVYNSGTGNVVNATSVLGYSFTNNASATIDNATGVHGDIYENGGAITIGKALSADCNDAATCYGLYIEGNDLESSTQYGIWGDNGDWVLDADGGGSAGDYSLGGDIILGEGQDAGIWYDGTDLKINSQLVGSGALYLVDGAFKTELGQFDSNVADGGATTGFVFDTLNSMTVAGSLIADFQNQGTSLFTIDKDGNVWAKGNIYSDKGFGMSMKNIGGTLAQYDLVAINTTEDNTDGVPRMAATSSAFAKVGFGVVQEACTNGSTCKVVFQGETLINVSNETNRGDYLYSSTSLGKAAAHTKQYDGMLGIATSTDLVSTYQVEMIFLHQPSVDKLRVADKNRMHADYREAAIDYTYANETNFYDIDENVRKGLYFDTFQDKVKVDSSNSNSIVDDVNQKAGLFGGITLDNTNTDTESNTFLEDNAVNDVFYFDRTNNQTRTEPDTVTQVLTGVDPNWFNGVSLVNATQSSSLSNPPSNLSKTYNGGLIKASGRYATGEDDGQIYITIKSDNEATDSANPTITIDWQTMDDPASPAHSGSNVIVTKGTATTLETGTNDVTVTFTHANYNSGDNFKIASWFLEPATANDRGSRQIFPERAYIIGTDTGLSIIDADTNKMWMRFVDGATLLGDSAVTSVFMLNGKLYIGTGLTLGRGVEEINFYNDGAIRYNVNGARIYNGNGIKDRNSLVINPYDSYYNFDQYAIPSRFVNDVHAVIVGTTELIAAATDDGIALINHKLKKTIDLYDTATDDYNQVWLTDDGLLYATNETDAQLEIWSDILAINSDNSEYKMDLDETTSSYPEIFKTTPTISTNPDALSVTDKYSSNTEEVTISGWGYVEGDGAGAAIRDVPYGVTFDSAPTITITSIGNTNTYVPSNPAECNDASSGSFHFSTLSFPDKAQVNLNLATDTANSSNNNYYCYSWVVTGPVSTSSQERMAYLTTDQGLTVIGNDSGHAYQDVFEVKTVKQYTKDYISEKMVGDIRAMWPFEPGFGSGLSDASTQNETLTDAGTVTFTESGVRGHAASFDGSTQGLYCDDTTCGVTGDLGFIGEDFSWSGWIKPDVIEDEDRILGKATTNGYDIHFNANNSLTLELQEVDELIGTTPIPTGEWTHFAFTHDESADTAYFYLNGNLVQVDTTVTTVVADGSADFCIGQLAGSSGCGSANYYDGLIDELTATGEILTPTQVKRMYESGKKALQGGHQSTDYHNNLDSGSDSAGAYNNAVAVGIQNTRGGSYAYVAMEDGDNDGDGWINKIDLASDTVVQTFNNSSAVSIPDSDVQSFAVSNAGLELVGMDGTGAYAPAYNANMSATTGTYYSDTISLPEDINNAYAWINEYVDSDCATCDIDVYASNNGGSTWTPGTLTTTDNNQWPPEKEYLFSFASAGSSLKFRVDFTRDSGKAANVYIEKYGIAWFNDDNVLGGSTGGIFTQSSDSVAHGDYIELTHGQSTNDLLADGWMFDSTDNQWKEINTGAEIATNQYGDGSDGALALTASLNMNTTDSSADSDDNGSFADMIAYKIDAATASGTTVGTADAPNGLVAGDEVLLINMQGDTSDITDVGNYEFLTIDSISGNNIIFTSTINNSYDGTTPANQKVIIQRVPQYTTVTLSSSGSMTVSAWDQLATTPTGAAGYYTGIVAFRAFESVNVGSGTSITTDNLGYAGGAGGPGTGSASHANTDGTQGESTIVTTAQSRSANAGGGGAGYGNYNAAVAADGGGGAGHSLSGTAGSGDESGNGGGEYGSVDLTQLFLGSGGGGGGSDWAADGQGGDGGNGGGIIFISSANVSISGSVSSDAENGDDAPGIYNEGGGGAGAGGSIYINSQNLSGDTLITASAGTGGAGVGTGGAGGAGATGRVKTNITSSDYNFLIEQVDDNTVRLYNYSGSTQNLRLDVSTGGNGGTETGSVSLAPLAADVDAKSGTNSIWINKTDESGNLLKLQNDAVDRFTIDYGGNATLSGSLKLNNQLQLANFASDPTAMGKGSIYYNSGDDTIYFYNGTTWGAIGGAGGGGGTTYWQQNSGALTPISTTLDTNFGATATASAKISLAGSLDRGMAAVVINQTEAQDIWTASASGVTRLTLTNDGDLLPGTDDTQDIGSNAFRWQDLFLGPSTLHIGEDTTDEYTISYNTTSDYLGFNVNGTGDAEIIFDSLGKVGIGDITPEGKLDVDGAVTGKALVQLNELGDQDIISASVSGNSRFRVDNNGYTHSQRFVDLANSAYYLDPAATAMSLNTAGDGTLGGGEIFLYDANTYISGDGTDLTFKDSYLTAPLALSESGTTQLHAGFTMNSIVAALNELMNISLGDTTNIFLNSFRQQEQNGLLYQLFEDGAADEFEGLTGIDVASSAYTYDATNDYFSRANPTSDITHNTQSDFTTGTTYENIEITASPTIQLAKTTDKGDGSDGDITINDTKSLTSDPISDKRVFADSIAYKVSGISSNGVATENLPLGIEAGDEVILINLQGDNTNYSNVGVYEFLTVSAVSDVNTTFTTNVSKTYGVGSNSNITGQNIVIQRVPHYSDVTILSGGTLTADAWEGLTTEPTTPASTAGRLTGLVIFRAAGTVDVQSGGTITMTGKGYRAGTVATTGSGVYGYQGESTGGYIARSSSTVPESGGGGGYNCTGGAGGGYGTGGAIGTRAGTSCGGTRNAANSANGDANLTKLRMGGAGGAGGQGYLAAWNYPGKLGGNGGGIIFIAADNINALNGSITNDGIAGTVSPDLGGSDIAPGGGGGGAGGAIYLAGDTVDVSGTVTADGKAGGTTGYSNYGGNYVNEGGYAHGGAGGDGRIKIDSPSLTGSTSPTAVESTSSIYENYGIFVSDELSTPNTVSFDQIEWTETLNTYGEVQAMTRSGATSNSKDGSWEEWRPVITTTNETIIDNMDVHTNWTGYTPYTVLEDTESEWAAGVEKTRVIEYNDLNGKITTEKYLDNGDGSDGSITVSATKTIDGDLITGGRTYADGINYVVSSISSISLVTSATPNGIVAGDEVLLINLQGDSTNYDNVGTYEFLKVESVSGTTLNFESAVSKVYGVSTNADLTGQKIIVQRVPQYNNVTVDATGWLTTSDWDGTQGGVLVFRAAGKVLVEAGGDITTVGKGYRAGTSATPAQGNYGWRGESTSETYNTTRSYATTPDQGGGGGYNCTGGAGGGYGTGGVIGTRAGTGCGGTRNAATSTVGTANLDKMYFGSAGGAGGHGYLASWSYPGKLGGDGGGIIFIGAGEVEVEDTGYIYSTGSNGTVSSDLGGADIAPGGGGGGAGGSLYIKADTVTGSPTTDAFYVYGGTGGTTGYSNYGGTYVNEGGYAHGGAGGYGRIRIDTNRNLTATSDTTPYLGEANNIYHTYGYFTSDELSTANASILDNVSWIESIGNTNEIQIMTRTGNTTDSTDGTWEAWKPVVDGTNEISIATMSAHTDWTGTNVTVADGDVARNENYWEDDDATATDSAKFSSSTQDGYAETDLGVGNEVNLTSYDYITFWIRSSATSDEFTFSIGENAGTELTETIKIDSVDSWQKVYWDITDIAAADKDSIRYIRITNNNITSVDFYMDNIKGGRYISSDAGYQIPSTPDNYIQYRVIFSGTDTSAGATLEEISLAYRTSGTNTVVADGDVTRDVNEYEDEDEATATNITKTTFSDENGYIERDLGGGSEVDISSHDYVSFWIRASETGKKLKFSMGEATSTEQEEYITINTANTWQKVYWDISDITATSRDAIRYFRLTYIGENSATVYLDDLAADTYLSNTTSVITSSANEYFQYKLFLSTTDNTVTPTVDSVTINYTDQLGHVDGTFSEFDAGVETLQSEASASGTVNISANKANAGTGRDGSISVSTSVDMNTDTIASGRSYADGVQYTVTDLGTSVATVSAIPNGILAGEEVVLINLQGDNTNYANVGTYEFLTVQSINGTALTFTSAIQGTYGVGGNSNLTGQDIVIQRVPHYVNVTVANGGILSASDFDGSTGGILFFRATGKVLVESGGYIWMGGKGYRASLVATTGSGVYGYNGGSTGDDTPDRTYATSVEQGGGGGYNCTGGAGGGHGTGGVIGTRAGTGCGGTRNAATSTYGYGDLQKLYMGSAGGAGGQGYLAAWNYPGKLGGDGGGIIYVSANTIEVEDGISSDGSILATGTNGTVSSDLGGSDIAPGGGGGGAGGSLYLIGDTVTIPVNTGAAGGTGGTTGYSNYGGTYVNEGGYAHGGAGGDGRVRIDANTVTGTTTPTYYSAGLGSEGYYPYALFTSDEINTSGATSLDSLSWTSNVGASGMIQMMTRSGATADSTDGTWEEWKPIVGGTNELALENADTHSNWNGYTPQTVTDDTQAEFDAISVEKFRTSSTTSPSVKLDNYINDGDGSDGAITISSAVNINNDLIATGRTGQADGISYKVDAATASGTVIGTTDTPNGIIAGDEVLLINLQGGTGDVADVGNYEFHRVSSVSGNEITFNSSITNSYDGTTPSNQKVIVQRVPQYTDVTVQNSGSIVPGEWDALATTPSGTAGYQTGIVAFRASGKIHVNTGGNINAYGKGYRAGTTATPDLNNYGWQGESTSGGFNTTRTSATTEEEGGGGGYRCTGGAGGGYGTGGVIGTRAGTACGGTRNAATGTYGDSELSKLYFGSAGGAGGHGYLGSWSYPGKLGGDGGGIIYIAAEEVELDTHPTETDAYIYASGLNGTVSSDLGGADIAPGGGGGGAGGSVLIEVDYMHSDDEGNTTILAAGGTGGTTGYSNYGGTYVNEGGYAHGGAGGSGRIKINANRFVGTSNPTTYTNSIGTDHDMYPYGIYTSDEMSSNGAVDFKTIEWIENIADTNGNDVQVLTRTGNTADSTTGTWEDWKPATGGVNEVSIDTMDTHTNWTGTNITVAEGDTTRDKNYYEDEDEATAANITKMSTSTQNGYADMDLGGGSEIDLSGYKYLSFWVKASKDNANFKIGMGEVAATEQEENIIIEDKDIWQKVYWDISDITTTGKDSVRYFRITYLDSSPDTVDLYLDNIVGNDFYTTPEGSNIESAADNYIQYRLIFSATDTTGTNSPPEVYRVGANYITNSAVFYSQEGNVTRNENYYEDEDETTSTNVTRLVSSSTQSDKNFAESTIAAKDLTNYDYISFWVRSSKANTEIPMRIGMGEAEGDEQYMDFIIETSNTWQKVFWDITDIAVGDRDAITKLRITNFGPYVNDVYIDDFSANTYIDTSGSSIDSTANSYFQYRAILSTTDTTSFPILDQVSLAYSGVSDVVSKDYVANTLPRRANLISWADLGTGSIDYWASRDGGTTWTTVTMTEEATESGTTKIYSGFADLTSQPEGTDMRWKARITGNAALKSMAIRWEEGGGADLAEWYPTNDQTLQAAEVISADTTSSRSGYIKRSGKAYDPAVLGVISTAPGVQIGEMAENTKRVALAGRVPVLVASDSAAIKTGDFLVSSHVPGRAMKAIKTGYTIGKALEDWDPSSGKETVMVFMNLGTHINEDDIGGIDKSSLEDIFGENIGDVLGASDSASVATDSASIITSSGSAEINTATNSAEASGSALLNPVTATNSATVVQESLTSRLKKIAEERLDAMFNFTGQEESTDSADLATALNLVTSDSIAKSQSSLFEARDKFVDYGSTVGNTVGASTINAFNGLNAASATIYGRLVATSVDVYGKLTAVSGEFIDLFARRITTDELATDMISPISEDGTLHFRLGANATASGRIVVENASGSAVTTFDDKGNITTLGDLIAQNVITSTISAQVATFTDASISGELDVNSARIDQLESKLAQIESLDAQTAQIVNATVSGTLFADDISEFSNKVAAAIEEPTLLEKLLGTADATNTVETIDNYFANHDSFVTELDTTSATRLGINDLTLTQDDLVIDATAVFVNKYLDVNGSAYIAENLGLGQSLVISDSMFITAGSIDYAPVGISNPTLNIQPSGKGILSLMAGLFTLDESGTANINGDLTIAGDLKVNDTLLTNMIAANDFTNPFQVQLATMSGEVLGETTVQESRFEILNELGVAVATISAQGKADFSSGIGIGSEILEATDSAQIESEKTSGTATIKSGSSEIVIISPIVTTESLIYITPLGSTNNKVLYVKELTNDNSETPELESGFKVGFDTNTTSDVKFNWWIVN